MSSDEDGFEEFACLSSEEEDEIDFDFDEFQEYGFEPPPLQRMDSFVVVPEDEILQFSRGEIEQVMDILSIPSRSLAAIILRAYNWNREKVIEQFTDNAEKVCLRCGIRPSLKLESVSSNPTKQYDCSVCLETRLEGDGFALACGHRFCADCWRGYLKFQIRLGSDCIRARCMDRSCQDIVHEEVFRRFLDKSEFLRYEKFILRSYVDDNANVKWCPAPGCTNCIRSDRKSRKEPVRCTCGFSFCFRCADYSIGDHSPAACALVEKWRLKSRDESENVNWMIANTKKCPKCRSPIEKNGGCMHMTCKKNAGGCGYDFCWLCRGPWSEHGSHSGGYYACNKYNTSEAKREDDSTVDVKTELELYMFYYHRYESHMNACKIAKEQLSQAEEKSIEVQKAFEVRSQDTKFLKTATQQLIENRRVLQYSYVIGYYLKQGENSDTKLFEFLQEDLEKHTNHLSELYEMPLAQIKSYQDFVQWKANVTNYTRVTSKFLNKFVEGVQHGLSADFAF